MMTCLIRRATADDRAAILALVTSERLNAIGLVTENFLVACDSRCGSGRVTGAGQILQHSDGSRELATVVVARDRRGSGLAGRLLDALLSAESGPVAMVTGKRYAVHYARWGFSPVSPVSAPARLCRAYCVGQLTSGVHALLRMRRINALVILRRDVAGLPGLRPDVHARTAAGMEAWAVGGGAPF
jgi:amino-acid N-acetyltransferase